LHVPLSGFGLYLFFLLLHINNYLLGTKWERNLTGKKERGTGIYGYKSLAVGSSPKGGQIKVVRPQVPTSLRGSLPAKRYR
jgi:hypothetical protein